MNDLKKARTGAGAGVAEAEAGTAAHGPGRLKARAR